MINLHHSSRGIVGASFNFIPFLDSRFWRNFPKERLILIEVGIFERNRLTMDESDRTLLTTEMSEKKMTLCTNYFCFCLCCCFVVAVVEVVVGLWMLWHSPSAFRLSYHKYWTLKNNSWSLLLIPPSPPEKPFIAREPPK